METIYQKNFVPNKLEELDIMNKNFETMIMSTNSGNGYLNFNKSSKCFNKLNMKKLADEINNSGTIGEKTGTSGFNKKYTQDFMKQFSDKSELENPGNGNGNGNFRRIRSEITLKSLPSNMSTFK
jgi:hypothetical protein